jgi:PIN domain nuclease of toxin-antitoxin system
VARHIEASCISAVNLSEVLGHFARDGHDPALVLERLRATSIEVVPFGPAEAADAAALVPATRKLGLSLGDRACLALARDRGVPAVTADRTWSDLDVGVSVEVVR